jgi:hypothetical protein
MSISGAFTSAGTTIGISSTLPSTYDASGYGGLSYSAIGEVTDLGEFGREYALVTHNPLGARRTVKRKGSYNDGQVAMTVARVPTDTGQADIIIALDSDDPVAFEIVLQDGTTLYFAGVVMSYTTNVGSVDQITSASVMIEITTDIVEVAAS